MKVSAADSYGQFSCQITRCDFRFSEFSHFNESFKHKAFKKPDFFDENVFDVLVGAELSWPLRTNAEAANEGCSSFYTAALRTHTLSTDLQETVRSGD